VPHSLLSGFYWNTCIPNTIEVSEWTAIEDGYIPQDQNRLRAMAAAMEISFDRIAMLVLLCREAWEL
jgi:hypothetical protein